MHLFTSGLSSEVAWCLSEGRVLEAVSRPKHKRYQENPAWSTGLQTGPWTAFASSSFTTRSQMLPPRVTQNPSFPLLLCSEDLEQFRHQIPACFKMSPSCKGSSLYLWQCGAPLIESAWVMKSSLCGMIPQSEYGGGLKSFISTQNKVSSSGLPSLQWCVGLGGACGRRLQSECPSSSGGHVWKVLLTCGNVRNEFPSWMESCVKHSYRFNRILKMAFFVKVLRKCGPSLELIWAAGKW